MAVRDPASGRRLSSFYAMALGKGGSETSIASNPCARLGIDEADDAVDAGQIKLAMKRTASYGAAGGGVIATTVNSREGRDLHPALEIYEESTKTRLAHLCQHCHEYVVPDLENFLVERAAIACPACGVVWSEEDRHKARNAGKYRHGNESAEVFGVIYTALDYFWEYPDQATGKTQRLMDMLASDHRAAMAARERGDMSQWNTYLRKQWCRPESQDDAEVPATNEMAQAARCSKSPHERGQVPTGYGVITVGCDMGKRDAWHITIAMRNDLSWAAIDWGHRATNDPKAEPSPVEQRAVLDALHERILRVGKANAIGIDVGYSPDLVIPWARSRGYRMVRGDHRRASGRKDEDRNRHLPSWAEDRRQDDGTPWLFLDGGAIKAEIAKSLAREPGEPGAGLLPRGQEAGDWLIRHLCAEVWDSKHGVWVKRPGRDNHLLDCLVYAWALAVINLNGPKPPPRRYGVIKTI
jgi:phage terminase large subunit GpA-like protein